MFNNTTIFKHFQSRDHKMTSLSIRSIMYFLKSTQFLQSILHICMVYITPKTQSNILVIVILLHPELENDISTPAGQKPPDRSRACGAHSALVSSWMPAFTACGVIMYKAYICKAKSHRWPGGRLGQRFRAITEFFVQIWTIWLTLPNWSKQNCDSKFVRSNGATDMPTVRPLIFTKP